LLHGIASSHKAAIVRKYLKQKKVVVLTHHPDSPELAQCDFFLFQRLKNTLLEEKIPKAKNLGSAIFRSLNSIPRKDYEKKLSYKEGETYMVVIRST
jgi:hypothetical protein